MSSETDGFPSRFVGLDLHKEYVVVAAVDARQQVLLKPRRISLDDLAEWAEGHLGPEDAVVLEATGNAWFVYDLLTPRVGRCVVANPLQVKWIAAAAVKTDPHDALRLAKLLAANLVPEVWVPPKPVRELRALIAHRRQLVKQQTRLKNQLHSLLHRHHIHLPPGDPFAARNQDWWRQLDLSPSERLRLHQTLDTLAHVQKQVRQVEQSMTSPASPPPRTWSVTPVWVRESTTAARPIEGRASPNRDTATCAGCSSPVLAGQAREAAWVAVQKSPHWKEQFRRLTRRKHPNVAIVAAARKMLVALWHILTRCVADRNAQPERVAFPQRGPAGKLMVWSWRLTREQRGGLTSRQFVRYGLLRLGLGDDLTHIRSGQTRPPIAPPEEVLALCPELRPVNR